MIKSDIDLPLHVTTHACANGETVECRLKLGDTQVGQSLYLNGRAGQPEDVVLAFVRQLVRSSGVVA